MNTIEALDYAAELHQVALAAPDEPLTPDRRVLIELYQLYQVRMGYEALRVSRSSRSI